MKHSEAERGNLVERYVGGSLRADESAAFEDHLIACAACQEAVAWAQDLRSGLADVASESGDPVRSSTDEPGEGAS